MRKAKAALIACGRRGASSQTPWEDWVSTSAAPVDIPADGDGASLRERIEQLAYSYWEQRGRQHGSADEDWYRAEAEVLGRREPGSELEPLTP